MTDKPLVVSSFGTTAEITGAEWVRDGKDSAPGEISVRIHYLVNGTPGSQVVLLKAGEW